MGSVMVKIGYAHHVAMVRDWLWTCMHCTVGRNVKSMPKLKCV